MESQYIRDFYGRILGRIDTESNGNQVARDFYGRILGRYDKFSNTTRDFYGKIIGQGNSVASLIWMNASKK